MKTALFLLSVVAVAALIPGVSIPGQAPPTFKQALAKMGISSDRQSLYRALHDPRPAVRSVAAAELAEMKDPGTVSQIEPLIANEPDHSVAFTFAQSLNLLGSSVGTARLQRYCSDDSEEFGWRLQAAEDLAQTGNYKCLSSITPYLGSQDTTVQEGVLLYLLHVPEAEARTDSSLGARLLTIADQKADKNMRELAGKVILQIGDDATKATYRAQHPR